MFKKYFSAVLSLLVVSGMLVLAGCSSSSDSSKGTITVCNTDDEEYIVELYRDTDDNLVKKFSLDEWYNAVGDQCDDFSDVVPGTYYIVMYEKDSDNKEISDSFYLDGDEHKYFSVSGINKGSITICNIDDNEYIVELYRETDDSLVEKFFLDEWYDVAGDQCDDFSDVDSGRYYIVIYEENADNSDTSDSFYLGADQHKYFTIESPGEITED